MRVSWMAGAQLGAVSLALLTAAVAGRGVAVAQPAQVAIVDFAFNPGSVTVPAGAQVTWRNTGQAPHTTTATGGQWNSGTLNPGGTFSFTFSAAGSFAYRCNIHQSMMGTVVVQAGAGAAPPAAAPAQPRPPAPAMPRTGSAAATDGAAWWLALAGAVILATGGALGVRRTRRAR